MKVVSWGSGTQLAFVSTSVRKEARLGGSGSKLLRVSCGRKGAADAASISDVKIDIPISSVQPVPCDITIEEVASSRVFCSKNYRHIILLLNCFPNNCIVRKYCLEVLVFGFHTNTQ